MQAHTFATIFMQLLCNIYVCNQNAPSDKLEKDETTATYEYALCTEKKRKKSVSKGNANFINA